MNNCSVKAQYIIIYTTVEATNEKLKDEIVQTLLEQRLAACIQISEVQSSYIWNDKITTDNELRLAIKTKKYNFQKIQEIISKLHNYDTPQIIAVDISDGSDKYLKWIEGVVQNK